MELHPVPTAHDTRAELADRLERIRLDRDLTFDDLGWQIGIDGATVFRFITKRRPPTARTLHKIRVFVERVERTDAAAAHRRRPAKTPGKKRKAAAA